MSRPAPTTLSPLLRFIAAWCAALVLALTLFAASPVAHDWLHAAEKHHTCANHKSPEPAPAPRPLAHADADADTCAVVLFASGVEIAVGPVALTPPQLAVGSISPVTAAEFYLVSPRYLRQPERGPPQSWVS